MPHPAEALFKEIVDPLSLTVINTPKRIWVFGGQLADKGPPPASIRDKFLREALLKDEKWLGELAKPEDFPDWWLFSGYDDLLTFERDAGYLSRLIVLFAESPGAIAELGAFAMDQLLHQKIFVVVSDEHRKLTSGRSFINLGPLKRIESAHAIEPKGVCVIGTDKIKDLQDDDLDLIFEELSKFQTQFVKHSTEKLRKDNPTHKLLLLADLIDLFQVSKAEELLEVFKFLEINFPIEEIKQSAKLLRLLGLIEVYERGREHFYVRLRTSNPLIDYEGRSKSKPFDRLRFKIQTAEMIKADVRRKNMLERFK